jgi:hypothetical protein
LNIQDLGSIGELIAALATLTTLVYLAIQVKHAKHQFQEATQQARSRFTLERSDHVGQIQRDWFSPDGQNKTMMKALLTDETLSREENFEFHVQMSIFFGEMLGSESLQRRGLIDSEFLELRNAVFTSYLSMPRVSEYWKTYGKQFYAHDNVVKVVDSMLDQIEGQQLSKAQTEIDIN